MARPLSCHHTRVSSGVQRRRIWSDCSATKATVSASGVPPPHTAAVPLAIGPRPENGWVGARMEPHMCNRPDVHGIVVRTRMSSATQVVVRLAAAPRPPGRSCRARNGGRDRSTHLFRCPLWHLRWLGCALHPKPPRRVATSPAVLRRTAGGRSRAGAFRASWCTSATVSRSASSRWSRTVPTRDGRRACRTPPRSGGALRGREAKLGRGPLRKGRRRSRRRGQGRRGWPEPTGKLGRRAARAVWATAATGVGSVDPPRPTSAVGRPSR